MNKLSGKCMLDLRFKSLQSSAIACAVIFYVRREFCIEPVWRPELTALTFHDPFNSLSVLKCLHYLQAMHEEKLMMGKRQMEEQRRKAEMEAAAAALAMANEVLDLSVATSNLSFATAASGDESLEVATASLTIATPLVKDPANKENHLQDLSPVAIASLDVM